MAQAKGESIKYDGRCRERGITAPAEPAALRFCFPQTGQTVVEDLIKGPIVFNNAVLDDLVLLRSNGYPTYHFSVVLDDALMGITHVIRGDDHVTNTPRQVPLFEAMGYPAPRFAHLPMILGPDKVKMGVFAQPLRVALTGRTFSPGIYDVMELLGKERTLRRIDYALQRLSSPR